MRVPNVGNKLQKLCFVLFNENYLVPTDFTYPYVLNPLARLIEMKIKIVSKYNRVKRALVT